MAYGPNISELSTDLSTKSLRITGVTPWLDIAWEDDCEDKYCVRLVPTSPSDYYQYRKAYGNNSTPYARYISSAVHGIFGSVKVSPDYFIFIFAEKIVLADKKRGDFIV